MPTNTPNLNLIKPLVSENYDITKVTNDNADKIDEVVGETLIGWNKLNATLTYASADSPTFVASTSVDLTSVISVGMKLKLTQTTIKYFFVTAITSTTITLYGGTDYTLVNATITIPYFSSMKAPFGFPMNPDKWSVIVTKTSGFSQVSPTLYAWYNFLTITLPIGIFNVTYESDSFADRVASGRTDVALTLSTANNYESNNAFTARFISTGTLSGGTITRSGLLNVLTKTIYYLNISGQASGLQTIGVDGTNNTIVIKAVCAYL